MDSLRRKLESIQLNFTNNSIDFIKGTVSVVNDFYTLQQNTTLQKSTYSNGSAVHVAVAAAYVGFYAVAWPQVL